MFENFPENLKKTLKKLGSNFMHISWLTSNEGLHVCDVTLARVGAPMVRPKQPVQFNRKADL